MVAGTALGEKIKNEKKNILLIRTSSLGDVIFNIPLANRLKENGYNLTWLVGERGINVIKNNPCVDDYIFAPVQKWQKQNPFKSFIEYLNIIKEIRSRKFDIALDTHGLLLKSGIFLLFSGAKRRIAAADAKEFSTLCANELIKKEVFSGEVNSVKRSLVFADYLGAKKTDLKFSLPPSSKEDINKVDELLKDLDKSKSVMVVCPATTWRGKHWSRDNWKALLDKISENYSIILTGTPKDKELVEYIQNDKILNLVGKTSSTELIEVFRRADIVVSVDSGSAHLARATEIPKIVSIFCCTKLEYFAPLGDTNKYITVSSNICMHCNKRKCKLKENKYSCTFSPSVEEVMEAIEKESGNVRK